MLEDTMQILLKHLMFASPTTDDQISLSAHSKEFCLIQNPVTCKRSMLFLNSVTSVHMEGTTPKYNVHYVVSVPETLLCPRGF
jgi:hypothetical protein